MKIGSFFSHPYQSLILKTAGVILILGTLVDYLMLTIPPDFLNSEWLASLISDWVARGAVPLLGVALLFLGVWFEPEASQRAKKDWIPLLAFVVSALLGIAFLVLAPLYFNSSRLFSAAQTRQINDQADLYRDRLGALLEQQKARVSAIVSNEDQFSELQNQLNNLDLSDEQQNQLRQIKATLDQVKSDPKALDREVEKARTEGLKQIETQQQEALAKVQSELRRDRFRVTLSSLLFSGGYLMIAWLGLGGNRSQSPASNRRKDRKPKRAAKQ
ncbi:MAG: HpsJ family protein [Elainella sp. Prado103]|jgi:hypothetical protein|nr:HpsJ family protein [Elainella sp. Prado103]